MLSKSSAPEAASTSEALAYSIPEAARHLGNISRAHIFKLIAAGKLRTVKLGRRTLIPRSEIIRLLGM